MQYNWTVKKLMSMFHGNLENELMQHEVMENDVNINAVE